MKVVIPGGTGFLGRLLARELAGRGDEVVVLSRQADAVVPGARVVEWDGRSVCVWAREIDGAAAVINLAGRSVNCRYTAENLREMMDSRVDSTRAVGQAIAAAARPPGVWLQMSTATIYAHTFGPPNDEPTGRLGGGEPGAPADWDPSIWIAKAWERTLDEAETPRTRKVALRAAMVMSPAPGGPFPIFRALARLGLGGPIAGGRQYVSWIADVDFVRAVLFLVERDDLAGPVNLAAPDPLPQRDFMAALRAAARMPIGLPATAWMMEIAAFVHGTETELLLKSRRVVPTRLRDAGFVFALPTWRRAALELTAHPRPAA